MIIHLVRDLATIRVAVDRVDEALFNPQTEILDMALWIVARDGYKKHGDVLPRQHYEPALQRILHEQFPYHGLDQRSIADALSVIFSYKDAALSHSLIAPLLEEFILERKSAPFLQHMIQDGVSFDLVEKFYSAVAVSKVSTFQIDDMSTFDFNMFADGARIKTGYAPVDHLLGGIRLGEAIGLLGPMKGGKTSLCQSLACDFIKQNENNRVTYVTYEEPTLRQWPKLIISFINKFHRDLIEGKAADSFSPEMMTELKIANTSLARQLTIVDMSGAKEGQGSGGIMELELLLDKLHSSNKLGQLVIVDHVLPLVTAYMGMRGLDPSNQMRHQIQAVCERVKTIVSKFNVALVLAHQMDSAGNKLGNKKPTHMDAAECKLFAQYLHDVLCLGCKQSEEVPIAWLNLSASRTRPEKAMFVQIDGARCQVKIPPSTFELGKQCITTKDSDTIGYCVKDEEHHVQNSMPLNQEFAGA